MHHIKKFFKVLFIIALICLIAFGVYRYQKLKKEGKLEEVFRASNETNSGMNGEEQIIGTTGSSSTTSNIDENKKSSGKDSSRGYVVEDKDYDDYYNQFNFDNALLLYEGKQHNKATKEALDILIKDADDPLYSKPIVVFENFNLSTNKITVSDLNQYKAVLKTAKDQVGSSYCTFTFGYNTLRTVVNKITITKN